MKLWPLFLLFVFYFAVLSPGSDDPTPAQEAKGYHQTMHCGGD